MQERESVTEGARESEEGRPSEEAAEGREGVQEEEEEDALLELAELEADTLPDVCVCVCVCVCV